ncbi:hypothetical protein [Streptomyces sp. NPDC021356]|uniref:hypothetical protein n=1 Tax=Streptomyces sp. NPDC021356 TaxID=3154900 RepID=UPI0033D4A66E
MARVHRTTTAATLLITVAVSALTGCVTVQRSPSGPGAASSAVPAPRAEGSAGPRAVQAPAREALERAGSSDSPRPATRTRPAAVPEPAAHPHAPAAPGPPARHPHPAPHSPARPAHRPVPAPPRPPASHRTGAPAPHRPPVPAAPGVCALGKQYGGWRPNSPEARICGQTYGR